MVSGPALRRSGPLGFPGNGIQELLCQAAVRQALEDDLLPVGGQRIQDSSMRGRGTLARIVIQNLELNLFPLRQDRAVVRGELDDGLQPSHLEVVFSELRFDRLEVALFIEQLNQTRRRLRPSERDPGRVFPYFAGLDQGNLEEPDPHQRIKEDRHQDHEDQGLLVPESLQKLFAEDEIDEGEIQGI